MDGVRLGGLWKSKTKDGKTMLSGNLTHSSRLLIFPNGRKERENDPDFIAYLAPNEKRDGGRHRDDGDDWG